MRIWHQLIGVSKGGFYYHEYAADPGPAYRELVGDSTDAIYKVWWKYSLVIL